LDAHEFAPKGQKSLILLTFSLWHLNWLYNTYCASLIDAAAENPEATKLLGFFLPIFHSAILIDAKRQNSRVDGI